MRPQLVRGWVCLGLFILVSAAVYWPTVFHEYGFRDDYAHLREAREIPGHLVRFTSSYGRPAYGALLVASVSRLHGEVANLQWLRLGSVFLLVLVATGLTLVMRRSGWSGVESAAAGLAIALLPAAQITVGWAIAWPIALSILAALGGFAATDAALVRTGWRRAGAWCAGLAAYLAAGLIYQPSVLFFAVPLAAALLLATDTARARMARTLAHSATALGGLVLGFVTMRIVFAAGLLKKSAVVAFETDPLAKLLWFFTEPVANALGLFVLRDRFDTTPVFWAAVASVAALIAVGFRLRVNRAPIDRWTALFCIVALPIVAFAVNLAAVLRVPSYRTTYALAGLVVVFLVYALRNLRVAGRIGRNVQHTALGLMLLLGAVAANRHAYTLIAEPQGREWQIVLDAAMQMPPMKKTTLYVIRSGIEDRATRRTFADEFGSLSSDTDWAVSEMLKCALRRRFPDGPPAGFGYKLDSGVAAPPAGTFDVVIDMRKLRQYRRE